MKKLKSSAILYVLTWDVISATIWLIKELQSDNIMNILNYLWENITWILVIIGIIATIYVFINDKLKKYKENNDNFKKDVAESNIELTKNIENLSDIVNNNKDQMNQNISKEIGKLSNIIDEHKEQINQTIAKNVGKLDDDINNVFTIVKTWQSRNIDQFNEFIMELRKNGVNVRQIKPTKSEIELLKRLSKYESKE